MKSSTRVRRSWREVKLARSLTRSYRAVVTPLSGVQGLEITCLEVFDGLDRKQALFGDFMHGPRTMMRGLRR